MRYFVVPYLRLFPIWRFGSLHDPIDGTYVREGWGPDRFGDWKFDSEEEAESFLRARGLKQ